ncbi:winged helix-turn-helix transcriptional regulator [Sinomicrobium weinanense]|uniref:Helix-turn-helix transcriptional regulator n=1 Tax=Sinomicrobium weinanense TaxID=2842200 RepID=A0A926JSK1_9FLAO|nr:helix-turn-helix domain-containing protein [Sinomicrobium weinanense]MBC9796416.1 helix-turn-helix transcriptional regulator [Sinomicrobium weinanense]
MNSFKEIISQEEAEQQCPQSYVMALTDTMNVISGKWKLPIIASLLKGKNRFKDLLENIEKITPRMLSKELKELEMNSIIARKVYDQTPVLIKYELTASGESLADLIDVMIDWGLTHRNNVL